VSPPIASSMPATPSVRPGIASFIPASAESMPAMPSDSSASCPSSSASASVIPAIPVDISSSWLPISASPSAMSARLVSISARPSAISAAAESSSVAASARLSMPFRTPSWISATRAGVCSSNILVATVWDRSTMFVTSAVLSRSTRSSGRVPPPLGSISMVL